MKLSALVLLIAAGSTIAARSKAPRSHELTASYSYEEWCEHFNAKPTEEGRKEFAKNLAMILEHNANPSASYKRGVNQFTAMPANKLPTGKGRNTAGRELLKLKPTPFDESLLKRELPPSVDWREKGVVSPVKNQGHCGSCWAFATTATVESHVALNSGNLFSLSPQQLVACAPNDDKCGGVGGCMGSIPELAYDYLVSAGGMAEEWSYPYVSYSGATNGSCSEEPEVKITIDGYVKLPENNATAVMAALAHVGPLAINIDASVWHLYESGVFDGCSYDDMEIDHVVELVGYGTDDESGVDYWLVRNSWSPTFGENGYIRLKRDPVDETPCGVDDQPTMGTGCEGPGGDTRPVQYPCGMCGTVFDVSYPTGADTA